MNNKNGGVDWVAYALRYVIFRRYRKFSKTVKRQIEFNIGSRRVCVFQEMRCWILNIFRFTLLSPVDAQLAWRWLAPEVIREHRLRPLSDVWSFGIFFVEVLQYGAEPYPGLSLLFARYVLCSAFGMMRSHITLYCQWVRIIMQLLACYMLHSMKEKKF